MSLTTEADAGSAPKFPMGITVHAAGLEHAMATGAPYHFGSEPIDVHFGMPADAGFSMKPMSLNVGMKDGAYHITLGASTAQDDSEDDSDRSSSSSSSGSESESEGEDKSSKKEEGNGGGIDFSSLKRYFEHLFSAGEPDQTKTGAHSFVQMTCGLMEHGYTAEQAFVTAAAAHQVSPGTVEHELAKHMAASL